MKKFLKLKLKASFTIEAAVIVPISMILIVALLYLSFYVHDNVVMNAVNAYEILDSAKDPEEGTIISDIEKTLGSRLITASNVSANATASDNSVSAETSASFFVPLKSASKYLNTGTSAISSYASISNLDGRKILLKYKAIIDGISGIVEKTFGE